MVYVFWYNWGMIQEIPEYLLEQVRERYLLSDSNKRVGQWFCMTYDHVDSTLFYEKSEEICWKKIGLILAYKYLEKTKPTVNIVYI